MLQKLNIKNYILLDEVELIFNANLNIITGETGAGKSILLGALSLILGKRADTSVLWNKDKKCVIEGSFKIENEKIESLYKLHELDAESPLILRREISTNNKSRAFVNDTPVNLSILKSFGDALINIHAQHDNRLIGSAQFQLEVLDALCGHQKELKALEKNYKEYQKLKTELQQLQVDEQNARKENDYLQYQFNELNELELSKGEQTNLEEELNLLTNAEQVKTLLSESGSMLSSADSGLLQQLYALQQKLSQLEKVSKNFGEIAERLNSCIIELEDVNNELENHQSETHFNAEKIEELNNRLSTIYSLLQKHGLQESDQLLYLSNELSQKLLSYSSIKDEINLKEAHLNKLHQSVLQNAKTISSNRQGKVDLFEQTVNKLLKLVALENAQIKVNVVADDANLNGKGIDQVETLFSSNLGSPFQQLQQIASGGELSRLMLCIKSLIADNDMLPTIVFDEIDTGISGETAIKVGNILADLAKNHQVIAITHLPQIAGKGDVQYHVYKEVSHERTFTRIKALDSDDRILEIARMLSGNQPSKMAMANAKELLSLN